MTAKSSLAQLAPKEASDSQIQVLGPRPSLENSKPTSYLLGYQRKLDRIDAKKGQQYEAIDHKTDECIVQAFRKVSYVKKPQATSYVSSFPFSGHSHVMEDGTEVQPPIEDFLPNQEAILANIEQAGAEQADIDAEVADNPFVFLMNQAKLKSFSSDGGDSVRLPTNFSMFNKQTEFPYETIPNVFKISPPEQSDSD